MTAAQGPPDPTRDFRAFPVRQLHATSKVFRAHAPHRSAWWFDSSVHGRFNLHGARGTCYAATRVRTAVREKLRDQISASRVISRKLADSFIVSVITTPSDFRCAAVSSARAVEHGIVRELVTTADYDIPQQWAQAFDTNGFDGVFYGSAYTTGPATAIAIFGGAGGAPVGYAERQHMTGAEACQVSGIAVVGPPTMDALTII
ncbi:hypothetical protein ASF88_02050 [Leifsonia sp. Leaf336]|uniref:RES family NAD+ phosphorylase n=1 Tax=Leifsonia sp. Leaf336 TaxID=1736341 RepID=UPI0006FB39E7|nr:RES family NAD+ phosphorylase [Leifsonia sp. Leaf336]KQR53666.1 hypothetical protein ASF88_02050 [Leifsonia sp. Leaf336]